jgi:hypothetical protein
VRASVLLYNSTVSLEYGTTFVTSVFCSFSVLCCWLWCSQHATCMYLRIITCAASSIGRLSSCTYDTNRFPDSAAMQQPLSALTRSTYLRSQDLHGCAMGVVTSVLSPVARAPCLNACTACTRPTRGSISVQTYGSTENSLSVLVYLLNKKLVVLTS